MCTLVSSQPGSPLGPSQGGVGGWGGGLVNFDYVLDIT